MKSFKETSSCVIKLNPLGRYNCETSPICYHNALRKFGIDKVYSPTRLTIILLLLLFLEEDLGKYAMPSSSGDETEADKENKEYVVKNV